MKQIRKEIKTHVGNRFSETSISVFRSTASHTAKKLSLCSSTKNITSNEKNKDGKRITKTRREAEEELRREISKKR
jgi:hypothetical protein